MAKDAAQQDFGGMAYCASLALAPGGPLFSLWNVTQTEDENGEELEVEIMLCLTAMAASLESLHLNLGIRSTPPLNRGQRERFTRDSPEA